MGRVLLEQASGHRSLKGRQIGSRSHKFVDVTERPAATITNRVVNVAVEAGGAPPRNRADKPPYVVPTMAQINALPWNGFSVISTFAGCGGSSLGYRMAGFRVLYANEFVEAARESYAANAREGTVVDGRDIRTVEPVEILMRTGLKVGELDVLDGSPPCASFSTAGIRQKGWARIKAYSDTEQRSDDLFFEYIRILSGLRPRVFVAENVSGLVKGVAKGYFLDILQRMKALGYRVEARTLDAQWLGVPQRRKRVLFVGVREDLDRAPAFPKPLRYRYSLRDALPHIDRAVHDTSGQYSEGDFTNKPVPTISVGYHSVNSLHYKVWGGPTAVNFGERGAEVDADAPAPTIFADTHGSGPHQLVTDAPEPDKLSHAYLTQHGGSIEPFAIGEEWKKLKPGEQSERFFSLVRSAPDEPSQTITAGSGHPSVAGVTHPFECRKFTIAELRRICSFPDDFVLTGSYAQQWERLGRAVPPLMMMHLAAAIRDRVLAGAAA